MPTLADKIVEQSKDLPPDWRFQIIEALLETFNSRQCMAHLDKLREKTAVMMIQLINEFTDEELEEQSGGRITTKKEALEATMIKFNKVFQNV